ncbi:MAG: hypothetical protein ACLVAV_16905 [Clostridium sp.]
MKNNIVIMNFSGVYEVQGLKAVLEAGKTNNHIISQLDCQDIPGTNCYCDSLAEEEIGKRIVPFGPEGLHFFRLRQLPLSDKTVAGIGKGTF